MNGSWTQTLINELSDKSFREAYVKEDIRTSVAFQIRALRDKNTWSQAELGRRAGKPQSVIARLEDPDYGRFTLRTLLDMAATFDVALLVRFVSFSELIRRNVDLSPEALAVADYANDPFSSAGNVEVSEWLASPVPPESEAAEVIHLQRFLIARETNATQSFATTKASNLFGSDSNSATDNVSQAI